MHHAEPVVLLLVLMAVLVIVAQKSAVPYPVLLVLGGLSLSFVPVLPVIRLDPNLVLFFFLPPLLYPAALFTSWRDFRRNLRSILFLAIGLVLMTTTVVAWVAHTFIAGLPWAAAFALGAIVSPPDAVAAEAILKRLGVPARIQTVLGGESLVNDATALVAYQFAVAAMVTGQFSLGGPASVFVLVGLGGVGLGLLVGLIMRWVQRRLDDPPVQITISLLTPFAAYLLAERLEVSGVLAVVAAGIYLGWHSTALSARTRLQAQAFWEMVAFFLNGFIFIMIGLQLPGILQALSHEPLSRLTIYALSHQRHGRPRAHCLGFPGDLSAALAEPENAGARSRPAMATQRDHRLGGHARRRLARGRVCAPDRIDRPTSVSRSELHPLSHFLRHPDDAGFPRPDASDPDPKTRRGRRRRDRRRGAPRAFAGERSRGRFHRKKGARRTFPRGSDGAGAGGILRPHRAARSLLPGDRKSQAAKSQRRFTSACNTAPCRSSARRSSRCEIHKRSTTKRSAASSAISTWPKRG